MAAQEARGRTIIVVTVGKHAVGLALPQEVACFMMTIQVFRVPGWETLGHNLMQLVRVVERDKAQADEARHPVRVVH
jgi:hypothetical protein